MILVHNKTASSFTTPLSFITTWKNHQREVPKGLIWNSSYFVFFMSDNSALLNFEYLIRLLSIEKDELMMRVLLKDITVTPTIPLSYFWCQKNSFFQNNRKKNRSSYNFGNRAWQICKYFRPIALRIMKHYRTDFSPYLHCQCSGIVVFFSMYKQNWFLNFVSRHEGTHFNIGIGGLPQCSVFILQKHN